MSDQPSGQTPGAEGVQGQPLTPEQAQAVFAYQQAVAAQYAQQGRPLTPEQVMAVMQMVMAGQAQQQQQMLARQRISGGRVDGGRVMQWALGLAAVAGVAIVMVGLIFTLSPTVQEVVGSGIPGPGPGPASQGPVPEPLNLAPTVGPGGEGVPLTQAELTAPPPVAVAPPIKPIGPAAPARLVISKIGVNAPIDTMGLTARGEIQTPSLNRPNLVGWYKYGPQPGERGPSVVLGHKDTRTKSAVFSKLGLIRRGDTIKVIRADGVTATFTVDGVEQASKRIFPTSRVYSNRKNAELRLITCGGVYNPRTHSYTDNIIVYATLTDAKRA
ncbi:class F sortase [Rhizohabitans arisaemae]|uniref:class F sortase n=1 Tax=Rhizohabitans arisaemae TaxID=2720610 RepID=UPI0024B03D88|nr:class F sortase [Rhizohabitans arisaemae]